MAIERKARIKSRGAKAKRESPALALFRLQLSERGWCEAQGRTDEHDVPVCGTTRIHRCDHPHHVWPEDRDRGTHDPDRGLWLCSRSHDWAHDHSELAARLGLLRPLSGQAGVATR